MAASDHVTDSEARSLCRLHRADLHADLAMGGFPVGGPAAMQVGGRRLTASLLHWPG